MSKRKPQPPAYPEFPHDGLAVIEHGEDALTRKPTYWARYAVDGFGPTHTDHDPVVAAHRAMVDAVRWGVKSKETTDGHVE